MKKPFQIVFLAVFFVLLCLPMALAPFFHNDASLEKRALAKLPAYLADGRLNLDFSDEFESYVSDRLPLRAQLLTASNVLKGELLHTETSNVIVGREGWLYFNTEAADYLDTNALTDRQLGSIAVTLSLIEENVVSRGGRFTFVPTPNKSSIYGEYMPASFRRAEENNLTRLTRVLERSGVTFTDLRRVLLEKKRFGASIDAPLYHRRDSHWNYRGALLGWNAIMDSLGREHETYADAPCTVEKTWRGDLDKLLLPAGGVMDEQVCYDVTHSAFRFTYPQGVRDQQAQLENYMSDREDRDELFTVKNLEKKDGSSLYAVRDSFGRALLPWLIDSYETATFKRTDCPDLSAVADGTDLIYEIAERNLHRVIATAPFLYAPVREGVSAAGCADGGEAPVLLTREGYGLRLCGALPEDLPAGDCRVYLLLRQGSETLTLEAFPIYESKLLGGEGKNGFSAILSPELDLSGTYSVEIVTENFVFRGGEITA